MQADGGWLILGANGQVGSALRQALADSVQPATFWTRAEADFSNPSLLAEQLDTANPSAVINAAAYTAVDRAEQEEALACTVNAESVAVLARYAAARGIPLVHYSTDYVFDGSGDTAWRETDDPAPLNAYGRSKLAGEHAVMAEASRHLIFRTSWVYDAAGKNFFNTMLRLAMERTELNVVSDQIGAPSYAADLAVATVECLHQALATPSFPSGVYHLCGSGFTSWFEFAGEIFMQARLSGYTLALEHLNAISTAEYPTPAKRPMNSRLSTDKLHAQFGIELRDWREAVAECMRHKREIMKHEAA